MIETLADEWRAANVAPLWQVKHSHTTARALERSHHWPWSVLRALADKALSLQDMDVIERRVLLLENPEPRFDAGRSTVTNLLAGLQVLAPGESARPHRHSINAIRFVLSGSGATTTVKNQACAMSEGVWY